MSSEASTSAPAPTATSSEVEVARKKWALLRTLVKATSGFQWKAGQELTPGQEIILPVPQDNKKILKHVAFIRHGESKGNEAYRLHGRDMWTFDAELTDLGREQAGRLKECVQKLPVELVVVSPLTRAVQTCLIAFGDVVGKVPFIVQPVAKEQMTASDDVGRHVEELEKEFPMLNWDLLKEEPTIWWYDDGKGKEGETIDEFRERFKQQGGIEEPMEVLMERVRAFEKWLLAQPQQVVAVVSHGDFILALTGQDLRNAQMYSVEASDHIEKKDA